MDYIKKFMQGRYGIDNLSLFLLIISCILNVLTMFLPALSVISLGIFAYCFYRILSKDIYIRQQENHKFSTFIFKVKSYYAKQKDKFNQRKTHKFYKCPNCKKELRVPKNKGKLNISCPKCKSKFTKTT